MWWLLAPNPFVILADAAPQAPPRVTTRGEVVYVDDYDPLSAIGRSVRDLRQPPSLGYTPYDETYRGAPVWPYGLAFNVALGAAAVVVTTMRLRTPSRRLAKGVRIA